MTGRPDPTPEHPPERITDWAAWSEAQHRALYPTRPADPSPAELHRYAVAWGHADAALLTDWRMWEKRYNDALEVIRAMSVQLDAARRDATRLRERATLTEDERPSVDVIRFAVEKWDLADHRKKQMQFSLRRLLDIIDRLTGDAQ